MFNKMALFAYYFSFLFSIFAVPFGGSNQLSATNDANDNNARLEEAQTILQTLHQKLTQQREADWLAQTDTKEWIFGNLCKMTNQPLEKSLEFTDTHQKIHLESPELEPDLMAELRGKLWEYCEDIVDSGNLENLHIFMETMPTFLTNIWTKNGGGEQILIGMKDVKVVHEDGEKELLEDLIGRKAENEWKIMSQEMHDIFKEIIGAVDSNAQLKNIFRQFLDNKSPFVPSSLLKLSADLWTSFASIFNANKSQNMHIREMTAYPNSLIINKVLRTLISKNPSMIDAYRRRRKRHNVRPIHASMVLIILALIISCIAIQPSLLMSTILSSIRTIRSVASSAEFGTLFGSSDPFMAGHIIVNFCLMLAMFYALLLNPNASFLPANPTKRLIHPLEGEERGTVSIVEDNVLGDGNCMFHAIIRVLHGPERQILLEKLEQHQLRQLVLASIERDLLIIDDNDAKLTELVNSIEWNSKHLKKANILFDKNNPRGSIHKYLENMKKPSRGHASRYGRQLELCYAARLLGRQILLVTNVKRQTMFGSWVPMEPYLYQAKLFKPKEDTKPAEELINKLGLLYFQSFGHLFNVLRQHGMQSVLVVRRLNVHHKALFTMPMDHVIEHANVETLKRFREMASRGRIRSK